MPARISEAFTLRTYPYKEADLIVSFFTRDQGKLRGIARRAKRPKSNFGSGLERLSQVNLHYYQREGMELVKLDSCELVHSQFGLAGDYAASVALDFFSEVAEQLLPAAEPNEKFFRLLTAVLEHLRAQPQEGMWAAVTYFSLWAVRLSGFLENQRVTPESRSIAEEMLRTPIGRLSGRLWTRETAQDLRRSLIRSMEDHMERRLYTANVLETL